MIFIVFHKQLDLQIPHLLDRSHSNFIRRNELGGHLLLSVLRGKSGIYASIRLL
ncbi:hypothetical protein Avbf_04539 [Armadillidium vulgare]|nr:hypothetical protein Avbf_04539 [Armadillidium vulgare]